MNAVFICMPSADILAPLPCLFGTHHPPDIQPSVADMSSIIPNIVGSRSRIQVLYPNNLPRGNRRYQMLQCRATAWKLCEELQDLATGYEDIAQQACGVSSTGRTAFILRSALTIAVGATFGFPARAGETMSPRADWQAHRISCVFPLSQKNKRDGSNM